MKRILHFTCEFESVFLLNGHFFEQLEVLELEEDEVVYLTILPLKASLLPYTVWLEGASVQSNRELVCAYTLPRGIVDITLKPRFNYVYSPQGVALRNVSGETAKNMGIRCFWHIKNSNLVKARELLTPELSQALNDNALISFFADYTDALNNRYYNDYQNSFILIDKNNQGSLWSIIYKNGLIDNLSKIELSI